MDNKVICILPYTHCLVQTDGKIKLCCNSIEVDNPSIFDQDFNNLINNELHVKVRNQMENNVEPIECQRCFELERNNIISYRQEQNYINRDKEFVVGLTYLDVRFNNVCNLKCVMCSSNYSTAWVEDEIKLSSINNTNIKSDIESRVNFYDKNSYKWSIENSILDSIKANVSTLERIHFAGGEPLLSKEHNQLLEYLVTHGYSKNLLISYNTNITLITKDIIELWNQFKHVKVFLSIDGIGSVLEYVRYPIRFTDVENVFNMIQTHSNDNIRYVFHYTLHALNISSLPQFIEYKIKLPYNKISPNELFTVDTVYSPKYLDINILPKTLIDNVLNELKLLIDKYPLHSNTINKIMDKIILASNKPTTLTVNDLVDYCIELDRVRKTDRSIVLEPILKFVE